MSCFYVEPFLFSVDQRRRNEKLRTLKLKHLMPSVKQLENSVLGNSCPVSNAVEEESWVCPQHEMCSPKTKIPVQCFGIFHNRLLLHHSNRTVSCIFPAIKTKKMPLTWENLLRPFTKLWRSQTLSRTICSQDLHKPHPRTSHYPCDNAERWFFLHLLSRSSLAVSCVISLGSVF